MALPQTNNATVDVYLNDDETPFIMPNYQLHGLQEAWENQGRQVLVFAHEDERPGFRYDRPKLRVIVRPPPARPLYEEITILLSFAKAGVNQTPSR